MRYYTTYCIHLSLDYYHNAGLSCEETKDAIESIVEPNQESFLYSSAFKLKCRPSGFNSNWKVDTHCSDIEYIVELIQFKLNDLLLEKDKM